MSTVTLPILHFNDVYRVAEQKLSNVGTIDVTQFASVLDDLRAKWPTRPDGKKDGLVLFSGDLFAPSVESSVTRGSHMVPVLNYLDPDVSVTGNHDFDFGYPHLTKLLKDSASPWLLSNIIDTTTSKVPEGLYEYIVIERAGVRVGFIGLIEEDWITTISSWPANFRYRDFTEVGLELSRKLRDPDGENCDIIIALTHCRLPNDILLAKSLNALSPSGQARTPIENTHGVDILLGGHDHFYFCCKGVDSWFGFDINEPVLGAEDDAGDVLVIKSGTDFRELSELTLELKDAAGDSIRRKIINKVTGGRHAITTNTPPSQALKAILSKILSSVSKSMKAVVCRSETALDLRSDCIRVSESAAGNWFADVIKHGYDDALISKGYDGADGVIICAGTLRGDTVYGPGSITLGDIMEILPFDDSVVVLELDGKTIWETLEAGFSLWPATEGRFPVISGFCVTWDSRRPVGQRVVSVHLQRNSHEGQDSLSPSEPSSGTSTPNPNITLEEVRREAGGRKYAVVTREYMAGGFDGFAPLLNEKFLISIEEGQVMSTIVRKYLMGATYIKRMCNNVLSPRDLLHSETAAVISREKAKGAEVTKGSEKARTLWRSAIQQVRSSVHSSRHYRNMINIVNREHMSEVDCCDGEGIRAGKDAGNGEDGASGEAVQEKGEYVVIHPEVDGRMRDLGRP